jgi:hypothetical protein
MFLWPEAVSYAVYIINRSPTMALATNITPYEAFWGVKPDVANLQEFGTTCWVLNQGQLQPSPQYSQLNGLRIMARVS